MPIETRDAPSTPTEAGRDLVVPESSSIPKRPTGFIWDSTLRQLSWQADKNANAVAKANYFEVHRSTTTFDGVYTHIASVDNPTTGDVSYTDPLGIVGYWYKIRGVSSRGDKGSFTQLEEFKTTNTFCQILYVPIDPTGQRRTNAIVEATVVNTNQIESLDGYITDMSYAGNAANADKISGLVDLKLIRSSLLGDRKYTFNVADGDFELSTELIVPDADEAWLEVDDSVSPFVLKLTVRTV